MSCKEDSSALRRAAMAAQGSSINQYAGGGTEGGGATRETRAPSMRGRSMVFQVPITAESVTEQSCLLPAGRPLRTAANTRDSEGMSRVEGADFCIEGRWSFY